jgi:hypothetical protein
LEHHITNANQKQQTTLKAIPGVNMGGKTKVHISVLAPLGKTW